MKHYLRMSISLILAALLSMSCNKDDKPDNTPDDRPEIIKLE